MSERGQVRVRVSARLRLALSYAIFLSAAGAVVLFGVYVVLRYVPSYPITAQVPSDEMPVVATRGEILNAVVGVSGGILVALAIIGITGGWFLAGWILKPLQRINEAAEIAASGNLDHRINLSGRNDEFRQLADNFDNMLERLRDAFEVQERFAANASHELRTPLAVTATMLDVARRDPTGQDYPVLLERLTLTNDRAIGLTQSLLRLADANAITAVAEPLDLANTVRVVLAENAESAERSGVAITSHLAETPTVADAALLAQLVTNLVQNAIQHGGSPGAATVSTYFDEQRSASVLRVESSGARIPDDTAARLTEPFLRGAGRVSVDGRRGYGLGLAIVRRITEVHDGELVIRPRAEGGLDVEVRLPSRSKLRT